MERVKVHVRAEGKYLRAKLIWEEIEFSTGVKKRRGKRVQYDHED